MVGMGDMFLVQAVMGLTDNISTPLGMIKGKMDATQKSAAGLGTRMAGLAKKLLPLAVAAGVLLGVLGAGVGVAAGFEAQISKVGAVSGSTAEEMGALRQAALDLGSSTAWSAAQVGQAEEYLAMAGFSVQENIAALPGVLSLASAAQEDLGNTANVASNILSAFRIEAGKMDMVADTLTATFTSSNTTLSGLASTMANAGPVAAAAGASLADVAAMAGKLGDQGIDAAVAGTGIKIMFNRLSGPVGQGARALKELGITTADAAGNMRPIFDILSDIEAVTAQMGTADRAQYFKRIFGEEAISSVTALMSVGVDQVREYSGSLHQPGLSGEVAAKQLDNFSGATKMLGSAMEGAAISVGSLFLPVLTLLVRGITAVVSGFNAVAQTGVGKAILVFVGVLALGAVAVWGWSAAMWVATAATGAFGGVLGLLLSPIGIVIGVIAALAAGAYLVVEYWSEISDFFVDLWAGVQDTFSSAWSWLTGIWDSIVSFFQGFSLYECGRKLLGTFTEGIKSVIMAPVNAVKKGLSYVRNLLPFSDAKTGPLSQLTLSGSRMMSTLAVGVETAAPGLAASAKTAMAGVALATTAVLPASFPAAPAIPDLSIPAPIVESQKGQTAPARSGRTLMIQRLEITLPDVSDAGGFVEHLQRLVEQYDVDADL